MFSVNCKRGDTGVCLNVNPARPGAAYGYVDSMTFILNNFLKVFNFKCSFGL